jgi:hypothetical protein
MTNSKTLSNLFRALAGAGAAADRMLRSTGGDSPMARTGARIAGRKAAGIESPFAASRAVRA